MGFAFCDLDEKNENKQYINVSFWPLDENRSNDTNTNVSWM